MTDQSKTRPELIGELISLRKRIAELEQAESGPEKALDRLITDEHGKVKGIRRTIRNMTQPKRMEAETAAIAEIGRMVGSTLNIDEVYEKFAAEVRKLIPFDRIHVNLISPNGESFTITYVSGLDIARRRPGDERPLAGSITEVVVRARAGLCFHPANEEEIVDRFPSASAVTTVRAGMLSIMAVPLIYRDEVIGVLHFRSRTPNAYTEKDLRLAERIGAQIAGAIGSAQLFSDHQRAEEALRESEVRFRSIYEESPIGIELYDREGVLLDSNKACLEIFGIADAAVIKGFKLFEDPNLSKEFKAQLRKGESVRYEMLFDFEKVNALKLYETTKKGSIYLDLLITPLRGVTRESDIGYLVHVRDITARKQAEERLQRAEKMEMVGNLAGGVAHDLNNLLGTLIGNADLLALGMSKTDPMYRMVEGIMASGQKAAEEVQDLLTIARRGVVLRAPDSLNRITADLLKDSQTRKLFLAHPGVAVETHYDRNLLDINASAIHIERALANLISNALHAMPDKGTIIIRTENRYLEHPLIGYETVPKGEYAVLTVSDTGCGIRPEHMQHLFEPFYIRNVLKHGGGGLGLSVIWGALKDHDGYIDVISNPGQETIFSLYFPTTRDS